MKPRKAALSAVSAIIVYSLSSAAAYGLISLFFETPRFVLFYGVCMLSLVLLTVILGIILTISRHAKINEFHDRHNSLTYTLGEIARGNFDVIIDVDKHMPHHDIAEAMNDMARALGNLDKMRQDFVSNVSHEIQSPLTSIGGFAKLLKDDNISPEQRRHYAEIIEMESTRLSGLSENLMKLSSLDHNKAPLSKTEFRLDKQLKLVALALEPQWSVKNISLEAEFPKCLIEADEELLKQVFMNLIHNAIKFTPSGGSIQIALENDCIIIRDSGIGIEKEELPHIFERFYKADKARDRSLGGSGLGLSIAKKIVDLHGGSISAESEPGSGTVFRIYLPGLRGI